MDPYSLTLLALIELLRYLTVLETNMTPADRERREKMWQFWDRLLEDFEKLKPEKNT